MSEWLPILAPLASNIINKLTNRERVTNQEQVFLLLYSLTETTQTITTEMVNLRQDLNRMFAEIKDVQAKTIEVMQDTSYIKAKVQ